MRIALVSYEFAGIAGGGGIGTYVRNAARMLTDRGHEIEVFTSMPRDCSSIGVSDFPINTVRADRTEFGQRILPIFTARHSFKPFDVLEGPEYCAEAAPLVEKFPDLPFVVRLHTPSFLINEFNNAYVSWTSKLRYVAGGLRRGRVPRPYWIYTADPDQERQHAVRADTIVGPSRAIIQRIKAVWGISEDRFVYVPNVFLPSKSLLDLDPDVRTNRVTFLGRLEVRKGVVEFVKAVPLILSAFPDARFRLVGRPSPHPDSGESLKTYLTRLLGSHAHAVEFVDSIAYDEIPGVLADTDICVFPSIWENFPNVCLEAMAAGRGVIGSSAGGMAEIIDDNRTGLLVPPNSPSAIAKAVLKLLSSPEDRITKGHAARSHVLQAYRPELIGPLQESAYERAIAYAKARKPENVAVMSTG